MLVAACGGLVLSHDLGKIAPFQQLKDRDLYQTAHGRKDAGAFKSPTGLVNAGGGLIGHDDIQAYRSGRFSAFSWHCGDFDKQTSAARVVQTCVRYRIGVSCS